MQYVPKESVSKMFTTLFSANELLEADVFCGPHNFESCDSQLVTTGLHQGSFDVPLV